MKLALLAIVALLAACAAAPPDVTQQPTSVIARCGQAPQSPPFPPWTVAAVLGDPTHLSVANGEWNQHAEWAATDLRWSSCVTPLVDTTPCGASPGAASWKLAWPDSDPGRVHFDTAWWTDHVEWFTSKSGWSDCVEVILEETR